MNGIVTSMIDQLTAMERVANTPIPSSCTFECSARLLTLTENVQTVSTLSNALRCTSSRFR